MIKRTIILLFSLILLIGVANGQPEKRWYLKFATGPKWNLVVDNNTEVVYYSRDYKRELWVNFDQNKLVESYSELILGIPITSYAYIETGLARNDFRYSRIAWATNNKDGRLEIPLPEIKFTSWQMPLRIKTNLNLINQRVYLIAGLGFSDMLRIINQKVHGEEIIDYNFFNDKYISTFNAPSIETMHIRSSYWRDTHPFYFELSAGLEWFATRNLSLSVMANYCVSNANKKILTINTETTIQPAFHNSYSQQQNAVSYNLVFGIQYYFNKGLPKFLKPFDSDKK